MILAEKILQLRKKCNWSQEELAEKCGVSRQSVSKWEGGVSIPDLDKIILLGQLFGVTTDYLLKDTMETEEFTGVDELPEGTRRVSLPEANTYMELVAQNTSKMATGVVMCILSPVCMLLLLGLSAMNPAFISEDMAAAIGIILLLLIVAPAVAILITVGNRLKAYEFLEREPIELEYGVAGIVSEKNKNYEATFNSKTVIGVVLCIFSPIPLFITAFMERYEFLPIFAIALLLVIVSVAVYLFVTSGMIKGSYDKLLQTGDYSPENKRSGKLIDKVAAVYWMLIVTVYLAYSFITMDWVRSWIVWPIAGVAFGAVAVICKIITGKK